MKEYINKFLDTIKYEKKYSNYTINGYTNDLNMFLEYLNNNNKLKKIITPTERFSKLLKPFAKNVLPLKTIINQVNKK